MREALRGKSNGPIAAAQAGLEAVFGGKTGGKTDIKPEQAQEQARPETYAPALSPNLDRTVVLKQSKTWSRAILWIITGTTTSALTWANFAKIEEAIPATGKLEPQESVRPIQMPVGGVVQSVYVKEGQQVKRGDLLIRLDPTSAQSKLDSLNSVRQDLVAESQFYLAQLRGASPLPLDALASEQATLSPELVNLTKSRATLASESQVFRALIQGSPSGLDSRPESLEKFRAIQLDLDSRVNSATLQVSQLEVQLRQTQIQLATSKNIVAANQNILESFRPLWEEGGISRLQFLKQELEVQNSQSQVARLVEEQMRLKFAISQAAQEKQNLVIAAQKDWLNTISQNQGKIAEIDGQLTKSLVENKKRIAEVDDQIRQAKLTLQYQELRASEDGTIFDLKALSPGFVANSSEPVLKVVPENDLTAKIYISNEDIGFVKPGMKVDVKIDSFPSNEFGDIKGEITWIGADALPPDPAEGRNTYMFPAKIRLDSQSLQVSGKSLTLGSGMSLRANIKVRKRTVMSIFTEQFAQQVESIESTR